MKYLFSLILFFSSFALFSQDYSSTYNHNGITESGLEQLGEALGNAWDAVVECFKVDVKVDDNNIAPSSNYVS